jgi:hypothetical protein
MDGESKNAETYLPLPQPTRRRVCTGACVIHFILCGLPELGRAILIIEQRLFALGAMRYRNETYAVRSANNVLQTI